MVALHRDPERRYADAADMEHALGDALQGRAPARDTESTWAMDDTEATRMLAGHAGHHGAAAARAPAAPAGAARGGAAAPPPRRARARAGPPPLRRRRRRARRGSGMKMWLGLLLVLALIAGGLAVYQAAQGTVQQGVQLKRDVQGQVQDAVDEVKGLIEDNTAMSTVAPEQTGFELDRFQWSGDDRLEVEGRWFGVRGRRFVRPVLTVQVAGGRRRLLALLEHKPWTADEGATWIAAFPWDGPHDDVGDGRARGRRAHRRPAAARRRQAHRASAARPRPRAPLTNPGARPQRGRAGRAREPKVVAPPEPTGEPVLRAAGESRQQLERDLAGARAELGRLRARHEEELREARAEAREADGARRGARDAAPASPRSAPSRSPDEASRLREELQTRAREPGRRS